MLTKMYLTNFLSFEKRTEFDFTASKYSILAETNVHNGVLKGALFIGPNASGKSNALRGIAFLISLIKGESASFKNFWFTNYKCIFGTLPFYAAEYEFLFSGKKVSYRIEYDTKYEKISELLTADGILLLKRDGTNGELRIADTVTMDDQLDSKTLFLRTASFNTGRFPQEPVLRELMDYLFNSYYISGYNQDAQRGANITKYAEEHGVDKVNQYLHDFNYDFIVEYGSESSGEGFKASVGTNEKIIFFKRKNFPLPIHFYTESQGNQVFSDLLPSLISIIESPGMLIYDEFGNGLHNKLAEKVIRFFMEHSNGSQFFITSHHTNFISNSVFRPDQINLVSFHGANGSQVDRLSQFRPREAQNLEKMYLGGMFEGLPNYEEV